MQRARGAVAVRVGPVGPTEATRIRRLHQAGSLKLRFPRARTRRAEAVLVNTAGGLAGGDRLEQRFEIEPRGDLVVTTQAAERVYRSHDGAEASVETQIHVGEDAGASFLPQETILFDAGRLRRRLTVDCEATSRLLLCESVVLGRSESGESVCGGRLRDSWRVRCGGRLVFAEELDLGADWKMLSRAPMLGEARALATILRRGGEVDLTRVRELAGPEGGASLVDGSLVVRLLATDGYALRRRLVPLLAALSPGGVPGLWSL
ncbi:urease accessory protein UreD [Aureimonas jatrophae]|uniref:urease accessory protein UreD n=1 Tax=Aureimonas jatrophae TaxID=1166073 RepID=UPI000B814ECF|nr:urease accessory protein UreD [Aureimonas jatrophae]MBB3950692.1 urease accessory protein [Aureimonas jatrophae]